MRRTWRPVAAGVLDLLLGACLLVGFGALGVLLAIARDPGTSMMALASLFVALLGGVTLAGGILAIRRRAWWFTVLGSAVPLALALLSYALGTVLFPGGHLWSTFAQQPGAVIVYTLEIVLPLMAIALLAVSKREFGQAIGDKCTGKSSRSPQ